jgi:hypothetical protein
MLTTHPHLVPRSIMSRSYISSPKCLCACSGTALSFRMLGAVSLLPLYASQACWSRYERNFSLRHRFVVVVYIKHDRIDLVSIISRSYIVSSLWH